MIMIIMKCLIVSKLKIKIKCKKRLPGMGIEPMLSFENWILSPTP